MGLHNTLNDLASDSIPIFLIALIAKCIGHLRSRILSLLTLILPTSSPESVGPPLGGLLVLAEQLNLNRAFSYPFSSAGESRSVCVFCYRRMRDGEQVRRLDCTHLFHTACFDGWIECMRFDCPICRTSLLSSERVEITRRRGVAYYVP